LNLDNLLDTDLNNVSIDNVINEPTNNSRVSNPITLRSTARNSIVTYNALQKVFKSRFDEGRSHTSIGSFSDLSVKQPFLTDGRISYEKLLGKNTESFYNNNFYKNNTFNLINDLETNAELLNNAMFDLPFLKAYKSDASRYL